MDTYRYLFPFEKIPLHSRILIYGAGILGQEYLRQLFLTGYCKVVGFADRNFEKYSDMVVPVIDPNRISEAEFDYVVVAMRTENWLPEIKRILSEQKVPDSKIIYATERNELSLQRLNTGCYMKNDDVIYAYEVADLSFCILISGGIGDMVNQKLFIMELFNLVPEAKIDLYVIQNEAFPQWLYSDCDSVQNIILDLGTRYSSSVERYDLAISVYDSTFITVDGIRKEVFENTNKVFLQKMEQLIKMTQRNDISLAMPVAVTFYRRIYNGIDCHSWFNCGNIFNITDYHISIPYQKDYEDEFRGLCLRKYITVNAGNGYAMDGNSIAKSWPLERFERVLEIFKRKYPKIDVIQIGAEHEVPLTHADRHLMGRSFGLIAYILRDSIFHLDIEGGLVHLATMIGTKCIVLWGPTVFDYFSYPSNINVRAGKCHDCAGLYRNVNDCARHMEKPECMYSITPEMVVKEIDEYLGANLKG